MLCLPMVILVDEPNWKEEEVEEFLDAEDPGWGAFRRMEGKRGWEDMREREEVE